MPDQPLPVPHSMQLSIRHTTRYHFSQPVAHGLQRLRLTPKETQGQKILAWDIAYQGAHEELHYEDQNCNLVTLIALEEGASEVVIECSGMVLTQDNAGVIGRHAGHLPLWAFLSLTPLTRPGPKIRQLASKIGRSDEGSLAILHNLAKEIGGQVAYGVGATGVATTAEEAMAEGQGVCQDHAHIFIAAARMLEIPARYVSGYLLIDGQIQHEAAHAWAEAFVEGLGWVGFDISNGICPDGRYVRVATGRDYADAAPVTGISFGAVTGDLSVDLAVQEQFAEQ